MHELINFMQVDVASSLLSSILLLTQLNCVYVLFRTLKPMDNFPDQKMWTIFIGFFLVNSPEV